MPIQHTPTIKADSTDRTFLLYLESSDGSGRAHLAFDTPGLAVSYMREGDPKAHRVDLVEGVAGEYRSGGFVEVDDVLAPGVYQLGLPNRALTSGSERVIVLVRGPEVMPQPVEIHLVRYDPQDEIRMGVLGLANDQRHEFLRRALPRLTEIELSLGEPVERQLRERSGDHP